ncbi:acetate/propionate family kinase [Nigerium massiliense]|uniref:acetate/propionate family kinase n=1 Tax=Nigerium massiliense TaxID=1522317 RepID=UPI00058EE6BD|nr:acetate kinase [Nigerium massiliense]
MSKPVLLLNAGSSSIKYQVIDADDEEVLAKGLIQRIGSDEATIEHEVGGESFDDVSPMPDHTVALEQMAAMFDAHGPALSNVRAVGHRAVHGGDRFSSACLIDDSVVQALEELSPLAPLHNPPGIAGIRAAQKALPDVPHVAIFDTAFFADLPAEAYTYALDADVAEQHKVRRYGFHGTSHNFVSHAAAEFLGRDYSDLKQIVCHLGNGASMSAIDRGHVVDTSMGLTPLEGLVMGTRSGDVDPGLIFYLNREGLSVDDIDTLLNKKSGMLGLAGASDMRDVEAAVDGGDEKARVAWDVYIHRLVHYIGAYIAILGGVDVITFTAGVGENSATVRRDVCARLTALGVTLDEDANAERNKEPHSISAQGSPVTVLVVPTNEELQMAREVKAVVEQG